MLALFELWDVLADSIRKRKCTPIISNQLMGDLIFGNESRLGERWAGLENYPLAGQPPISRIAQYSSVARKDAGRAKYRYLEFLKDCLVEQVSRATNTSPDFIAQVRREKSTLTFSQLANERFHYPDFKSQPDNPLNILTTLDIPVFLTTSPHRLIEVALTVNGKEPRTEVYAWREDLEDSLASDLLPNLNFVPTVKTPLVFHLHGIDDEPTSLVLTEDDYLEFLVNVTNDLKDTSIMPNSVRNAVSYNWLLLMGYHMHAWDLRVLLHGMIKGKPKRPRSFTVQLAQESGYEVRDLDKFQSYLTDYFGSPQFQFDIYWGPAETFTQELRKETEGG